MHKTATLPLLLLALLGAASCGESDSVAPDDDVDVDVDVTGTWTGTLLFDIAGEGIEGGEGTLHLTQTASAVSGTWTEPSDDNDTGTVSDSITLSTLTLEWLTDDPHADCRVFNVSMVFAVSSTALTLTGASGEFCLSGPLCQRT